ncbi:hypothetical protein DYE49_08415 [Treponema rectale]|uniref:Putative HAD superfamily hydrolase n=1 Tax=Treponema rectale TaxID=744512 RepID=A0A840SAH0_9SPIR|nr:hypothetical protein [Treponema rectale]MBB5217794.1 putative HAD superfamily hydrolase [Treponema rectale]QOS40479.1 hypothetical protein DYE49_08415 [Treponema rectale]
MNIETKEKIYRFLVSRNRNINGEYCTYKKQNPDYHGHPVRNFIKIFRLNFHYRILRSKKPLYYKSVNAVRLPYLDGSESEAFKRQNVMHFAKGLLQYDVISFDIFDTLILRPFAKPTDLFLLIGHALEIPDFYQIRINAEKKVRQEKFEKTGNYEITISDIYKVIERRTGISADKGIQTELEYEKRYCFANPYMKRVYDMLVELGKKIIITSDMYIPGEQMKEILTSCGYTNYENLYVSCDYGTSKRSGGLYEIVKSDYEGKAIVHVGDNYASDINSANDCGLDTRFYRNCHEIGNKYRSEGMSEIIGSAYAGIINTHLHNGDKTYSSYYEYGFIYGGLYVLGYCHWIHEKCKKEGIEKVLFLARDGAIYQKVFNMLYDDVPNEYVLWSRIANAKYSLEFDKYEFIKRIIIHRAFNKDAPMTIEEVFKSVNLDNLIGVLQEYDLQADCVLTPDNKDLLEELLIENWDLVLDTMKIQRGLCRSYLTDIIGNAKKIAIVDVGWVGSGPTGLKKIIHKDYKLDCEVSCFLAAFCSFDVTNNLDLLMDNTIEPYMFSRCYNRLNYDFHRKKNNGINNILMEMFTQNTTPSFSGWNDDGDFIFDFPEIENYELISEIHKGIFDFCSKYKLTFFNDDFLFNISGYDAYTQFRFAIKNLKLAKLLFGNCIFARNIGFDGTKLNKYFK